MALAKHHLSEVERFPGFVYIGVSKEPPHKRDRPVPDDVVTAWKG